VQRISNLSRAYRVNLTVLALVALFTGAFLVFSVLALSVAQRAQQFALLGVLGPRRASACAGAGRVGPAGRWWAARRRGAGHGLAALALRLLGGDLGGGYFPACARAALGRAGPRWPTAAGCGGGAGRAAGGPARAVQQSAAGADAQGPGRWHGWPSHVAGTGAHGSAARCWQAAATGGGIPLAAYVAVALLLVGGIAALPWAMACSDRLRPLGGTAICCRCWPWSARAGCAARRLPSAAWSPA
jgi:putative ABC transport system permease protein